MTRDESLDLVTRLEEELDFDGVLPLYQFTWYQNIGNRPDERQDILAIARDAYDEMLRRHPSAWLGWIVWPDVSAGTAERADAGTPVNFLLDHTGADQPARLLVLVDASVAQDKGDVRDHEATAGDADGDE